MNFTLKVQSADQTIEVTQLTLLSLDNPNTTTTIEAKIIESLPNPGSQHLGIWPLPNPPSLQLCRPAADSGGCPSEAPPFHTGLPFTVLSRPYTQNSNGIFQASGLQYARRVPDVPLYRKIPFSGVIIVGTKQWLNPDAFVSVVDPATRACTGGDSVANCQFGNSGRNTVRGPHFTNSDIHITKSFPIREDVSLRFDGQMFNAFNHPNFALRSNVEAGVPEGSIPARFGMLESTISPPTGLLGVGLGGDSAPRMIAFQGRVEFR